jgi:FADH2 O2-dependent halogenase
MQRYDAVIVGSGFAGALLGRILASAGWKVLLVEKGRHPRFAIGESSTPLANLALERIGRSYGFPELVSLSSHGRWLDAYPEVGRGLKRGFSFYRHRAGEPFVPGPANENRLLVAASPNDFVADTQWLRSEVDQLFVELARAAAVEFLDETDLGEIDITPARVRLAGSRSGERIEIEASLVIDASGAGGFLRRQLPIGTGAPLRTRSALVFGHFRDVPLLGEVADVADRLGELPYPEDWAAVHHLIDEGWMYVLRFDDGLVSAGALLVEAAGPPGHVEPDQLWADLLRRYPTLAALFREATPTQPLGFAPALQRRLARSHGPRWVALPHTYGFVDPMFSPGIAWSLRGVERLGHLLMGSGPDDGALASGAAFERYSELLSLEIEQIDRLISGAYATRDEMASFAPVSMLYFALVSFAEAAERLNAPPEPWWNGFLGADDPSIVGLFEEMLERAESGRGRLDEWIREVIEPWNLCGFLEPPRRNHYPVDFDDLIRSAEKLGLTESEVRSALPRLRGATPVVAV